VSRKAPWEFHNGPCGPSGYGSRRLLYFSLILWRPATATTMRRSGTPTEVRADSLSLGRDQPFAIDLAHGPSAALIISNIGNSLFSGIGRLDDAHSEFRGDPVD